MSIDETRVGLGILIDQLTYAVNRANGRTTITPKDIELLVSVLEELQAPK